MIRKLVHDYGLIFLGIFLATLFGLITFFSRYKQTIIPGDIVVDTPGFSLYFPLGTSVALTLGIMILLKFFRVLK